MNKMTLTHRFAKGLHLLVIAALLAGLALGLSPPPVLHAATINVVAGLVAVAADGQCSLIEAIENANDTTAGQPHTDCAAGNPGGADTIVLPAGATYTLDSLDNNTDGANGLPSITSEITINGNGSTIQRSSAGGTPDFRIFHVAAGGDLTLNDLTITNGKTPDGTDGSTTQIHALQDSSPAIDNGTDAGAPGTDREFEIKANGEVIAGGLEFANLSEYFKSEYFKETGKRCGTKLRFKENNLMASLSDCTLSRTVIQDEYWPGQTYIIPTVFHIIHKTDGTGNISDQRVYDQVQVLNEDYRAIFGTLGGLGFDTKIQFELAGVTRTANDNWYNDNDEYAYKQALGWDQNRYLNVYVNSASGCSIA